MAENDTQHIADQLAVLVKERYLLDEQIMKLRVQIKEIEDKARTEKYRSQLGALAGLTEQEVIAKLGGTTLTPNMTIQSTGASFPLITEEQRYNKDVFMKWLYDNNYKVTAEEYFK